MLLLCTKIDEQPQKSSRFIQLRVVQVRIENLRPRQLDCSVAVIIFESLIRCRDYSITFQFRLQAHERSGCSIQMPTQLSHSRYSQDAIVVLETANEASEALRRACLTAKFAQHLEAQRVASGKSHNAFSVVIKPSWVTGRKTSNGLAINPRLIEALGTELLGLGFSNITILMPPDSDQTWTNVVLEAGLKYLRVDDEYVLYDFESVLGHYEVNRLWLEADFRISFAKNRVDRRCFYTTSLLNGLDCLRQPTDPGSKDGRTMDILRAVGWPGTFFERAVLLADRFEVHFALIDAWQSLDATGRRDTQMILASDNAFALDWVLGEKMELNPALNLVLQDAMRRWGTINIQRLGNLTPWQTWRNINQWGVVWTLLNKIRNP